MTPHRSQVAAARARQRREYVMLLLARGRSHEEISHALYVAGFRISRVTIRRDVKAITRDLARGSPFLALVLNVADELERIAREGSRAYHNARTAHQRFVALSAQQAAREKALAPLLTVAHNIHRAMDARDGRAPRADQK